MEMQNPPFQNYEALESEAKKHSPLPWAETSYKGWDAVIAAGSNLPICQLVENNPANAAFIVHAANNIERVERERDALLEALKEVNKAFHHGKFDKFGRFRPTKAEGEAIWFGVSQAIASVKGDA